MQWPELPSQCDGWTSQADTVAGVAKSVTGCDLQEFLNLSDIGNSFGKKLISDMDKVQEAYAQARIELEIVKPQLTELTHDFNNGIYEGSPTIFLLQPWSSCLKGFTKACTFLLRAKWAKFAVVHLRADAAPFMLAAHANLGIMRGEIEAAITSDTSTVPGCCRLWLLDAIDWTLSITYQGVQVQNEFTQNLPTFNNALQEASTVSEFSLPKSVWEVASPNLRWISRGSLTPVMFPGSGNPSMLASPGVNEGTQSPEIPGLK
ncbi:hypothetical protein BT96DRAFT_934422 [Gymnopus androsaceus JB14]|uniref:Uncharacterized protein n=1 Tax=Gymnopus androsaceus JB14 TaxID=1447944 RepID=A0A6A4IAT5_9AGAR|nr:hypothetical protein BT96DRAFT_934422 [Gymnopus androsaceus JB14]